MTRKVSMSIYLLPDEPDLEYICVSVYLNHICVSHENTVYRELNVREIDCGLPRLQVYLSKIHIIVVKTCLRCADWYTELLRCQINAL